MLTDEMRDELEEYAKIAAGDPLTTSLYESAVRYAQSYTGKKFAVTDDGEKDPLYWLAIKQLFVHWYDNRGVAADKAQSEIPISARELLNHIALSSDFEVIS